MGEAARLTMIPRLGMQKQISTPGPYSNLALSQLPSTWLPFQARNGLTSVDPSISRYHHSIRYIYMLPNHVVKKRLVAGELGYDGYMPDAATTASRDENELLAMDLVKQYTDIPVPKLIHQGNG